MAVDPYFPAKADALGLKGISALQKVTAAIRLLAYGLSGDAVDEYLRLSESTAMNCLTLFTEALCKCLEGTYFRTPTDDDIRKILFF